VTTTEPTPTGLDYQAAFEAMCPGLDAAGVKIHTLNDRLLRTVDRAARLRRAERERVKDTAQEQLMARLDPVELALSGPAHVADVLARVMEEIR